MKTGFPIIAMALLFGMPFAGAPRHYIEYPAPSPTVLLEQFQTNLTNGTGGTTTSDVQNVWTGVQSNRLTAGNAQATLFTRTFASNVNVCSDSIIHAVFFMKNLNQILNMQSLSIYLFTTPTRFAVFEIGSYGIRDSNLTAWPKWNRYYCSLKKFVPTNVFKCDSVGGIGIELRATAGVQDTITMGELSAVPRRLPSVATLILTVDDQYELFRVNGGPKLDSLCMDYTMFVNGGRIGQPLYSTETQLDSMFFRSRCSKPDIAPHLWVHDTIISYTVDSAMNSVRRGQAQIRGNGWCRPGQCAIPFFAYPYGRRSHVMDSALRASGLIDFARMARDYNQGETQQFNDPFAVRAIMTIGNAYDTTTAKAYIDTLIAHRGTGVAIIHKIDVVGCTEDPVTWCKDKWIAWINYAQTKVAAGTLRVVNLSTYMKPYSTGFSSPRQVGIGK